MKRDYFQIGWSPDLDSDIEGNHPYSIPRVKCPACGETRATSHTYPWIDPKSIFDPKALSRLITDKEPRDYSWDEFIAHTKLLRSHLKPEYPIASWTSFGQFEGKIYQKPCDIIVTLESFLFIRKSVLDALELDGFSFTTFVPKLSGADQDFLEVWVPPIGMSADFEFCPECERGGTKFKGSILSATIPDDTHLFRLRNNPNFLNFSNTFFESVKKHSFTGLHLAKQCVVK